jgi:hypothetical protein
MSITYTVDDLKNWLNTDPKWGVQWTFVLNGMSRLGHNLEIEYLIGRNFDGTAYAAYVSTGADNQAQATEWAADAIREWAGIGSTSTSNYFAKLARLWATNGPGKGHTAKCLGSTLDFLTLLSEAGSNHKSSDMLSTKAVTDFDVPGVFCWVFANKFTPVDFTIHTEPGVNIGGPEGTNIGPPGLAKKYWDCYPGNEWTDQTHHFAGYFSLGANWGLDVHRLHTALAATGDWSIMKQEITNSGDYLLGIMAARWGDSWSKCPRYIGRVVEQELMEETYDISSPRRGT